MHCAHAHAKLGGFHLSFSILSPLWSLSYPSRWTSRSSMASPIAPTRTLFLWSRLLDSTTTPTYFYGLASMTTLLAFMALPICFYIFTPHPPFGLWTLEFLFRSNVGICKPQRGTYGDDCRLRQRSSSRFPFLTPTRFSFEPGTSAVTRVSDRGGLVEV